MTVLDDMPMWLNIISNFGFPAFVTIYLLIRLEKSFKDLTNEVRNLLLEVKKSK